MFNLRNTSFLLFVTILNVINFVDRQFLASFANFIIPDLQLTNTEFGLLTGVVFIFFYTVAGLFVGTLADRYNRTKIIGVGVIIWSFFTAISGLAKNFITLAIPRLFIGIGESAMTPTTMSILADRYEIKKLGFAAGFYYMGVPLGVGVSLILAGYLGPVIGWRGCFYLIGSIGIVLGIAMLFVKDSPRQNQTNIREKKSFAQMISLLFKVLGSSKSLILTIAAGTFYHLNLGASVFDQVWAIQDKGLDRAAFAQASGWIFTIFGILGSVFGGTFSDWTLKKYNLPRTWFLLILTLLSMPFAFTRYLDPDGTLFWVGICVAAFGLGCFYGPVFAVIQELVPSSIRGTIVGFNLVCLNLLGFVPGSIIAGVVLDTMLASEAEMPYTQTLVAFSVMFLILGPILYYFAGKYYQSDKAALEKKFG
ncbi:MAG: MFS transporter [SAR86 cluster bacterium]|uniref:MFS transporter n=1 Tax=SAR86 cluster bacterium TaxID=2030880 RepID=A0A368BM23_9GAMM|nr:MAG: MFS transporter [SAR86 cluster bacterium]|tara:strand:+ start:5315 stop:6580 length:1266 start_codon:yes stop_codon:yes gene_type:complete